MNKKHKENSRLSEQKPPFKLLSKRNIVYVITLLFAMAIIYFGNIYMLSQNPHITKDHTPYQQATVTSILSVQNTSATDLGNNLIPQTTITFLAKETIGPQKGSIISVVQTINTTMDGTYKQVAVGDKVQVVGGTDSKGSPINEMTNFARLDQIMVLAGLLFLLLIIFGRVKGFNTIITLALTCGIVFGVFIPSIISGFNIHLTSIITCLLVITVSILLLYGPNKKSLIAWIGCFGGLAAAGLITYFAQQWLHMSGNLDENMNTLSQIGGNNYINLNAILFAAILIGALGAVMDVAISIASSISEIADTTINPTMAKLTKSGFNIGRDIMGAMANTLVMAYIGSALPIIVVMMAFDSSNLYTLNRETVILELLQAIVGSIGILLTIPLTTVVAAIIYSKAKNHKHATFTVEQDIDINDINIDQYAQGDFIQDAFIGSDTENLDYLQKRDLHAKIDAMIAEEIINDDIIKPKPKKQKRGDYLDRIDEIAAEEEAAGNSLFSKRDD